MWSCRDAGDTLYFYHERREFMQRIFEAVGRFVLTHLANIGRITLLYAETARQVT